jgi:dTDP-4-dehydrorhamnose reductase
MDVTAPGAVEAVLDDVEPDVIVNCAAVSDVTECENDRNRAWAVNARAVKRLAKHCDRLGAHLIQVSTDFVFNGQTGPYDETARPDPVNYYGRTKLAGENALREVGLSDWTLVRTVLLYGTARQLRRSNVVQWMIESLAQGETVHVVTDQWRTPTYVDDLADGIARIIDRDATGIYHLSGQDMVTIHELAETVADVFGFDASLVTRSRATTSRTRWSAPPRPGSSSTRRRASWATIRARWPRGSGRWGRLSAWSRRPDPHSRSSNGVQRRRMGAGACLFIFGLTPPLFSLLPVAPCSTSTPSGPIPSA